MHNGRMRCDVLIVGGGTGGVAAALALADKGLSVVLTEETDWLGGQHTSQIVPPDEHSWIEQFGCTRRYSELRRLVRQAYLNVRSKDRKVHTDVPIVDLNPGGGWVSRICAEPVIVHEQLDLVLSEIKRKPRVMYETVAVTQK